MDFTTKLFCHHIKTPQISFNNKYFTLFVGAVLTMTILVGSCAVLYLNKITLKDEQNIFSKNLNKN